jgi:hypothetical protein
MQYIQIHIDKKFLNFYEISDHFLDNFFLSMPNELVNQNDHNLKYKFSYDCVLGSIEFIQDFNNLNKKKIIVHEIYIREQYRNQGLCKGFIKYLIDKLDKKNILVIQTVISKILYYFLLRFEYLGKKFTLKNEGFVFVK